jgi:hypothetical protein
MKLKVKFIKSKDMKTFSTYTFRVIDSDKAVKIAKIDREKYDVVPIRTKKDEPVEIKVKIPALVVSSDLLLEFDNWRNITFNIWISREEYSFYPAVQKNDSKKLKCCRYVLERIEVWR